MGLPWDADRRHRLRPDGKPLILQTEIGQEGHRPGEWEFIIRYWSKVGVEVKYKQVDHALYATCWPTSSTSAPGAPAGRRNR